jgi:hypothetical protein
VENILTILYDTVFLLNSFVKNFMPITFVYKLGLIPPTNIVGYESMVHIGN